MLGYCEPGRSALPLRGLGRRVSALQLERVREAGVSPNNNQGSRLKGGCSPVAGSNEELAVPAEAAATPRCGGNGHPLFELALLLLVRPSDGGSQGRVELLE